MFFLHVAAAIEYTANHLKTKQMEILHSGYSACLRVLTKDAGSNLCVLLPLLLSLLNVSIIDTMKLKWVF